MALEYMSALLSVLGEKMKVISRNAEGCSEAGCPEANQRSLQLLKAKLLLCRRGHLKCRSFQNRFHNSGLHGVKRAARSKRIEDVGRFAEMITGHNQSFDVR